MGSSATQKTLPILSENANAECQGKLRNTENTTDPQRNMIFECHGTFRNKENSTDPQRKLEF